MPNTSSLGRPDVVSGTFTIDSHGAHVLFDTGATFSFISLDFARRKIFLANRYHSQCMLSLRED
jgi:hypothetical protein